MSVGGVMNAGFDQILNLYGVPVFSTGDIIDTYVYRLGITNGRYDVSTAVNLFKSVVNAMLLLCSDRAAKLIGQEGFF
jgi:putative aldouronate transport system permease protein